MKIKRKKDKDFVSLTHMFQFWGEEKPPRMIAKSYMDYMTKAKHRYYEICVRINKIDRNEEYWEPFHEHKIEFVAPLSEMGSLLVFYIFAPRRGPRIPILPSIPIKIF